MEETLRQHWPRPPTSRLSSSVKPQMPRSPRRRSPDLARGADNLPLAAEPYQSPTSAPRDTTTETDRQGADMAVHIPIGLLIKAVDKGKEKGRAAGDRWDDAFTRFDQLWGWPDGGFPDRPNSQREKSRRVTEKLAEQEAEKRRKAREALEKEKRREKERRKDDERDGPEPVDLDALQAEFPRPRTRRSTNAQTSQPAERKRTPHPEPCNCRCSGCGNGDAHCNGEYCGVVREKKGADSPQRQGRAQHPRPRSRGGTQTPTQPPGERKATSWPRPKAKTTRKSATSNPS